MLINTRKGTLKHHDSLVQFELKEDLLKRAHQQQEGFEVMTGPWPVREENKVRNTRLGGNAAKHV